MAQADVALVDGLLDEVDARLGGRKALRQGREGGGAALPARGQSFDLGLEGGLGEVAGHGQYDVLRVKYLAWKPLRSAAVTPS